MDIRTDKSNVFSEQIKLLEEKVDSASSDINLPRTCVTIKYSATQRAAAKKLNEIFMI